ncbi:hypothetical protein ACFVVQ_05350 [Paenibacillus chitinolyticus]|uniref:hypothetical protein n=1 Tax=Paenibacillus chitinolyticus TaxID=79263 RepID=UPI0036DA8DDE
MIALAFFAFGLLEWIRTNPKPPGNAVKFWVFFSVLGCWSVLASVFTWWPQPNQLTHLLLGWLE